MIFKIKCKIYFIYNQSNLVESFKRSNDDNKIIHSNVKSQNTIDYLILPYFISRSRDEIENLLKRLKMDGVFFIRELELSLEEYKYELSVYYKSNVYHLRILIDENEQCSIENRLNVKKFSLLN
jgi:hypothetical protein